MEALVLDIHDSAPNKKLQALLSKHLPRVIGSEYHSSKTSAWRLRAQAPQWRSTGAVAREDDDSLRNDAMQSVSYCTESRQERHACDCRHLLGDENLLGLYLYVGSAKLTDVCLPAHALARASAISNRNLMALARAQAHELTGEFT
jgi:hypothetical protein